MEVVGVVAASQQFMKEGYKLYHLIRDIREKYGGAPTEIEAWRGEIQDLLGLVERVDALPSLADYGVSATIESCKIICTDLALEFEGLNFSEGESRVQKTWKAIKGVEQEPKLRKKFDELQRLKGTLAGKISLAQYNQAQLITQDVADIKKTIQPGSDEESCLRDLFITDPVYDRDDISTAKGCRVDGTCVWITSTKEYTDWIQSSSGLLWLFGGPGKGKTFLSVYLTEVLDDPAHTLIYFFCDNKVSSRNNAVAVLRGLMHQLAERHPELAQHLLRPWKLQGSTLFSDKGFGALWRIFQSMIEDLKGIELRCVLDGLDECIEESLETLLRKIQILFGKSHCKHTLKLIIVSRRYPHCIERALGTFSQINLDSAYEGSVKSDIDSYIAVRVRDLARTRPIGERLASHIAKVFRDKSQGTFLWVSFMIEDFQKKTVVGIEKALQGLPHGLDEVYERILLQIKSENMTVIADILTWIALSMRRLSVSQLAEAVGVNASEHLSQDQICLSHVESCGHLLQLEYPKEPVTLSPSKSKNTESLLSKKPPESAQRSSPLVTFVHQSAKDFLMQQTMCSKLKSFQVHEARGRFYIMERLLDSMQGVWLNGIKDVAERGFQEDDAHHLARYAHRFWKEHLRQLEDQDLLHLVEKNKSFFADTSSIRHRWRSFRYHETEPILHFACEQELLPLVEKLLRRNRLKPFTFQKYIDRQQTQTPLSISVQLGNIALVQMLLKFGATVDMPSSSTDSEAHVMRLASISNRVQIFELLSKTKGGQKFIKTDRSSQGLKNSLLHLAASEGNNALCKVLLEKHRYNVDAAGNLSKVPFTRAYYSYGMVESLFAEDGVGTPLVNELFARPYHLAKSFSGEYGAGTPLIHALLASQYDLAKSLVGEYGASTKDHNKIIQALVERVKYYRLPLEVPMQMIFSEWKVDINYQQETGHTVLHRILQRMSIAEEDDYKFFRQCLLHGCDPSLRTIENDAPFHLINWFGFQEGLQLGLSSMRNIIILLLDGRLDINTPGRGGFTLLHRLIQDVFGVGFCLHKIEKEGVREGLARLLDLGADRNMKTSDGLTAIQFAQQCHDAIQDVAQNIEGYEEYYAAILAEITHVLNNYATVTNKLQRLNPSDFGPSKS